MLESFCQRCEIQESSTQIAPMFGMALYSAKALLGGRASDVWERVTENL
jgi:hypothetical protein